MPDELYFSYRMQAASPNIPASAGRNGNGSEQQANIGSHPENRPVEPIIYAKLFLTAVIWGGTFVAGRILAGEVGPFSASFLRFAAASFFLFLFAAKCFGRLPVLERGQFFTVFVLGMTGVFAYNVFFFSGLKTVDAGRASLIIATQPAFIAFFSHLFFREPLGSLKVLGIALSISGAFVVLSRGNFSDLLNGGIGAGEIYIFGCVASWVCYSLVGKVAMKRLPPVVAVAYACGMGALCLLPAALFEGVVNDSRHYSLSAWLAVFYLGLFGSAVGFIWYYEGIRSIGPSRAGIFISFVPVSSVALACLLLHEALDASLFAGAVLVVAGVFLTARSPGIPLQAPAFTHPPRR